MNLKQRGRRQKGSSALVVLAVAALAPALAQDSQPALHTRPAQPADATQAPVNATGHTNLPPEAEGEYPWNKIGGILTLFFEDGTLRGYMTDPIDPNPNAAPVTLPFVKTHADGHALTFTTRQVHGHSYAFTGHLDHGLAASPTLPGYYLLTGTLTQQGGQADGVALTLSLKRRPATP